MRRSQAMKDQLHILLASHSSSCRLRLSELVRRGYKQATLKVVAGFGWPHAALEQTAADILIADLDRPSAAAEIIRVLKDLPGELGAVALMDDPEPRWV